MTDAGTPWGEPRRDALAEVVKVACREWAGLDETKEEMRHEFALMIADAVLQHLASQRQEQGEGWRQIAEQESRNRDYYRSLVVEIGELFGVEARTADDGGISEDVLCAKVPELVRAQAAAQGEEIKRLRGMVDFAAAVKIERDQAQALVARLGEGIKTIRWLMRSNWSDNPDWRKGNEHTWSGKIDIVAEKMLAEIAPTTGKS